MADLELLEPYLEAGIRNTHFYNGRLLTAEDLLNEQEAHQRLRLHLGQALGDGVAHGLMVEPASIPGERPKVRVRTGLAVNRLGQTLAIPPSAQHVTVALAPEPPPPAPNETLFVACAEPPQRTLYDQWAYILVLSPAKGFEGRALTPGLGARADTLRCDNQYRVDGIRFRLLPLDLSETGRDPSCDRIVDYLPAKDAAARSKLRNLLAHHCLGTEPLQAFGINPFDPDASYGALDHQRTLGQLTDADVPLALVFIDSNGLRFVDNWATRRRCSARNTAPDWPHHVGPRRLAEGEAAFLQFQAQLKALHERGIDLRKIRALDFFRFLPAAGYLPNPYAQVDFFDGLAIQRFDLDSAFLRLIFMESFYVEAIDLCHDSGLQVCELPGSPQYLVFQRAAVKRPSSAPTLTRYRTGKTDCCHGQFDVKVDIPVQATQQVGNIDPDDLTVWAEARGSRRRYPAVPTRRLSLGHRFKSNTRTYTVRNLPPGSYRVGVSLRGFHDQVQQHTVEACEATCARFTLAPCQPCCVMPNNAVDASWVGPGWYKKLHLLDGLRQWPWPGANDRVKGFSEIPITGRPALADPTTTSALALRATTDAATARAEILAAAELEGLDPVRSLTIPEEVPTTSMPPEEGRPPHTPRPPTTTPPTYDTPYTWAKEWACKLQCICKDGAIDHGGIRLYVQDNYTPGQITKAPYAYVVFGEGGVYAPVLLTPNDRTLATKVPLTPDLDGLDLIPKDDLLRHGIDRIDLLAASWSGLVEESLGLSRDSATQLINAANERTQALQGSLQVFPGVDADLEAKLQQAGLGDPVALANTTPAVLAELTGRSVIAAALLIDQARRVVPREAWSLEAAGIAPDRIEALATEGITNVRSFVETTRALGDDQDATAFAERTGLPVATVNAFTERLDTRLTETTRELTLAPIATAPITRLSVIDHGACDRLCALGLTTVRDIATVVEGDDLTADDVPTEVVEAFGGERTFALTAIREARDLLNLS